MKVEREIIDRCKSGSRRAWRELYEAYSHDMYQVCLRYSKSSDDANDTLHDGFIKIFTKIGDFRDEGSFDGWIRRIFVTTALEKIRRESIVKFEGEEKSFQLTNDNHIEILEEISDNELLGIIEKMPIGYQTVIKLYCIEGYSHTEIAKILNITADTSRSQLMRAKQQLKKRLENSQFKLLNKI